jgi:hypothetical protein
MPHAPDRDRRRLLRTAAAALGAAASASVRVAAAAELPLERLAPQALRADLALWRRAVLERHPRWHGATHLDPQAEAAFARAEAALQRPLDRREAFGLLAQVNPWLRDGHTLLMPWLDGREPGDAERARRFPFGLDLAPDGALRLRSHWRHPAHGLELSAGTELLRINGVDAAALLNRLQVHSHGETALLQRHLLTLMWPHWLHALLGWQDRFELRLRDAAGRARDAVWRTGEPWQATRKPAEHPTLTLLEPGTGLLRVPTLDVDEDPTAFAQALREAYARLRLSGSTRLVIDLRGNTGGQSEAGAEVLRPLLERPAAQVSRARERLNEDNNGWLGWRGAAGALRELDVARDGTVQPLPPAERWRGRCAALVDETTYSAALLLATALQDHGLATLVGRPSGGLANQTGNMVATRLPASGFTAFIATREFVRPSGDRRPMPLQPDIVVAGAASTTGDAVLQRALTWLHENR